MSDKFSSLNFVDTSNDESICVCGMMKKRHHPTLATKFTIEGKTVLCKKFEWEKLPPKYNPKTMGKPTVEDILNGKVRL